QWHYLTNVNDSAIEPSGSPIGLIGHSEVPLWYEVHAVEAGMAASVRVGTSTAVISSVNPSVFGQMVTFTATVIPNVSGIPTGIVSFFDRATNIGNVPVSTVGGVRRHR